MSIVNFNTPAWLVVINNRDKRAGTYSIDDTANGFLITIFARNWKQVEVLRDAAETDLKRQRLTRIK